MSWAASVRVGERYFNKFSVSYSLAHPPALPTCCLIHSFYMYTYRIYKFSFFNLFHRENHTYGILEISKNENVNFFLSWLFFVFCSRLSIIGLFITGDEVERETGRNWNSTFDCCSTHHLVNTCLAAHMLLQRERRFFNPSTRSYILFYEKNKTQTTAKRRERMSETTNSSKPETAKVKLFR